MTTEEHYDIAKHSCQTHWGTPQCTTVIHHLEKYLELVEPDDKYTADAKAVIAWCTEFMKAPSTSMSGSDVVPPPLTAQQEELLKRQAKFPEMQDLGGNTKSRIAQ